MTLRTPSFLRIVATFALVAAAAACSSSDPASNVTPSCPAGPEAPLGTECTAAGLECRYGYAPVECGGRTVVCTGGKWTEKEHTDPLPSCGDAGGDTADTGTCPAGPEAPLGTDCTSNGLECKYGYEPIECGGRTVVCTDGKWVEKEHTDPQPACFDSGAGDGSSLTPPANPAAAAVPRSGPRIGKSPRADRRTRSRCRTGSRRTPRLR